MPDFQGWSIPAPVKCEKRKLTSMICIDRKGSIDAFLANIDQAIAEGAKSLLLMSCDENDFDPEVITAKLRSLDLPVFGGIFPQLISGSENLVHGSIVNGINHRVDIGIVRGLSDPQTDFVEQIEASYPLLADSETVFVIVDGLAVRLSTALESIYEVIGAGPSYLGGGAGSLSLEQGPCLYTNEGILQDCALMIGLGYRMQVGVEHGWHQFAGPFVVSNVEDNVITGLDYRPALEVYRETIESDIDIHIDEANFYDIAKGYPLGLERLEGPMLVRDLIKTNGENLTCVGEVPVNNQVYILKGDPNDLISASTRAAQSVACGRRMIGVCLFINCISRVAYLEDRFQEELVGVAGVIPDRNPIIGALSLGEIAVSGNACLEFYNKTSVVGAFALDNPAPHPDEQD
tara:strand:- start:998 stop:2209 length:1212 start_codon:yes stop_codon:yes gene_type:complete